MLSDANMEAIRAIIKGQDEQLRSMAKTHMEQNAGHHAQVFGNFINCDNCEYHVHASGTSLVEHTRDKVVNVTKVLPKEA